MSHRSGVLAKLRSRVKRGKGGKIAYAYLLTLLNDPCVFCGELGCTTFDHITPVTKKEELNTGEGINNWTNLAPCHDQCNVSKGNRHVIVEFVSKHLYPWPSGREGPTNRRG